MWFIVNIGSFVFVILAFPFFFLLIPAMEPCQRIKSIKKIRNYLIKNLLYSAPIRLIIESYLVLLIPALLNLYYLRGYTVGEVLNSGSSILVLVLSIAIPYRFYRFMKRNKTRLHRDYKLRKTYGSLYSNLNTE